MILQFTLQNRIRIIGKNNKVFIEENVILSKCNIMIYGNNCTLYIDKECNIYKSRFRIEDNSAEIQIGPTTTSRGVNFYAVGDNSKIIIGKDCMFSSGIQVRNSDAHSIINKYDKKRINPAVDVIIKDHVWVGANAAILKGTLVEENSIIGYGSVVTKNVKSNTVVAGNPAKEVKTDINWLRERM